MALARLVYQATRELPADERFGLCNQMRRSSISVPSNIAEGYARQSTADYLKFLRVARGSLAELSTQYEIAFTLHLLSQDHQLLELLAEVDRILQGLIRSLQRPRPEGPTES